MLNKLYDISQKIIDRYLNIYLWLFFVYTLCGRIIPLNIYLQGTINQVIFILLAFLGVLFVGFEVLSARFHLENRYNLYLFVFIGIMFISSLLMKDYGVFDNLKTISWTIIHFALLYSLSSKTKIFKQKNSIKRYVYTLIAIFGIAVLVSLYQYLFQINYSVFYIDRYYRQGFVDHRLFGIFSDPNYAAAVALISFYASFLILFKEKNKWMKGISMMNLLIQLAYIVLSGSRSVLIAYVVTFMIFIFLLVRRYTLIHFGREERTFYSVVAMSLAIVVTLMSLHLTKLVWEPLPYLVNPDLEKQLLDRDDVSSENISNNRFAIWEGYISGTIESKNIIFGLSPRNAVAYLTDNYPDNYISKTGYETHNAYVSIFAYTGIVGTGVIGWFIFLSIKKAFEHVFVKKDYNLEYVICFSIVSGLAVYAFFITDLFFMNNISTIIFWPMLGYINNYKSRWEV